MIPTDATKRPQAVAIDFGVCEHDDLICRGRIRIEEHAKAEEFDYFAPASEATTPAGHVAIRHQFSVPAASLELMLVRLTTHQGAPEVILRVALAIGVHDSEDWESIALGRDHTFAFLCVQEYEQVKE